MSDDQSATAATDPPVPVGGERILLFMAPTGDRSVLAEWLDDQFAVIVGDDPDDLDQAFDCCLVDATMFARHREALAERKERASPVFLPYLLVVADQDGAPGEGRLREAVDDVLWTPTRKATLQSRLVGLLSRRDLSKALAAQQERYRRILRTIPDPVFVLDEHGVVTESNPAFERRIGRRDSLAGARLDEVPGLPEDAIAALSGMAGSAGAARSTEVIDEGEVRAITYHGPDGTQRTAEVAVARLDTSGDDEHSVLFVFRDVTDREDREQALQRERERLQEFASMLAHEVRNPLNVAQGYLAEVEPGSEAERDALDRVVSAQARMEQMIKELMAHTRGASAENLQPVRLRGMAETAWAGTDVPEATLELDLGDESIKADPENLQTILENLFRNAVTHAGPAVTVRVGVLEAGGFYVEDDGPGIPSEEREAIFERGFTTSEAGSGLGLTLVQQMAGAQGWAVRAAESELGGLRLEFVPSEDEPRTDPPE